MIGAKYLNLGSGEEPMRDFVNVDVRADTGADVIHDLNVFPWPFADESFEQVTAQDVIEHLRDPIRVMEEVWRVLTPGGLVTMRTPHCISENSWIDPTHVQHFHQNSFDYFDPGTELGKKYSYYTRRKFRILQKEILHDQSISLLMEKVV